MTALTSLPDPVNRCGECGAILHAPETVSVLRPASDPEDFMQQGLDWVSVCVKCAHHPHVTREHDTHSEEL